MAGDLMGATAPALSPCPSPLTPSAPAVERWVELPATDKRVLHVPAESRTRTNHGVVLMGDTLASVYSSRRTADELGVSLSIGNGPVTFSGRMKPAQARAMARALVAAADAFDAARERAQALRLASAAMRDAEGGAR